MGWELFKNYLIAKAKFKPDVFLYENNKSASEAIKNQISKELNAELQYINSALVSAQNRNRFYVHNIPGVEQPKDRNIHLQDILETGVVWLDKSYAYATRCTGAIISDTLKRHRHMMVAEPVPCLNHIKFLTDKEMNYMVRNISDGRNHFDFGYIHCSYKEKSQCLLANLYKGVPYNVLCEKMPDLIKDVITIDEHQNLYFENKKIYKVKDKELFINGVPYQIKLDDGYYFFRKLTPLECERLQTMPDGYTEGVSSTQRYKCLGNGWTAEVIIHILSHMGVEKDHPIEVLSLYDGIGTGRYCLDKLGYTHVTYKAYEIDPYATKIALKNYPDIIQCGDAFQVRNDDWKF